jgi:hypothetical protein
VAVKHLASDVGKGHSIPCHDPSRFRPKPRSVSTPPAHAAFVSGYSLALAIGAAILIACAVIATAALRERRPLIPSPALEGVN